MDLRTDPIAARADALLATLAAGQDLACVRSGDDLVVALGAAEILRAEGAQALALLDGLASGWWAGFLTYELGRAVERVPARPPADPDLPDVLLARFEARAVFRPGEPTRVEGQGVARRRLEEALDAGPPPPPEPSTLGPWTSSLGREHFERSVERIIDLISRGHCFQVNLTRRLESSATPDPVALHRVLVRGNPAPHAALVRIGDVAVISASPERFLHRDGDLVETRPIKGTHADPDVLRASPKDRAENVMIVDLARNDLGRVCRYGTVEVTDLCRLERHPGLYHLVSTVRGRLREDVGFGELVRATFPPASITGAPKPRVMEIIASLEPVPRGVYCGAVGSFDADRGRCDLNVAIRTFTVAGGRTTFGVGGGIVADSRPGAEWEETELKAARLLALAGGPQTSR